MAVQPVLIAGQWRVACETGSFSSEDPTTGQQLPERYPVSDWADCDAALTAAQEAMRALRITAPERLSLFLTSFAEHIQARAKELVELAHWETALPKSPRLAEVELPRTTNQLRQAAAAVLEGSWSLPTIDTKLNIRSYYTSIGPVCIFGPNNFPFAFNGIAGGDFAAAIAAGNPVIAKANPSHPGTTRLLAEMAGEALKEAGLPPATIQLIYHTDYKNGLHLVADPRVGATAYTGSRSAGLKLKAAADAAGKLIYLELSSINPVVILPGALIERGEEIAKEFVTSSLLGGGQFCTNPGLVLLFAGKQSEKFIATIKEQFEMASPSPLLSSGVAKGLASSVKDLQNAGAQLFAGGNLIAGSGFCFANTLLNVDGVTFLAEPEKLQTEMFGNACLVVVVHDEGEFMAILERIEGSLTGCIYSDTQGGDDVLYDKLMPLLRPRVGRLLNDKMPTGVAVSPAMNHGGPYPATGHPGFTAVGIPASLRRFAMLQCFDNVRPSRLPIILRDQNSNSTTWRCVNGNWTRDHVTAEANSHAQQPLSPVKASYTS